MIQINVSVFYANATGFMVIAREEGGEKKLKKKNMQTRWLERKWTIRRVFCYGNEPPRLHASANKGPFHSVHRPVKWTSLFVRCGGGGGGGGRWRVGVGEGEVRAAQCTHSLSLSLSSQVCYRCLWLCCKIACSKYELIPLQ